jgi:hypothetical protein
MPQKVAYVIVRKSNSNVLVKLTREREREREKEKKCSIIRRFVTVSLSLDGVPRTKKNQAFLIHPHLNLFYVLIKEDT